MENKKNKIIYNIITNSILIILAIISIFYVYYKICIFQTTVVGSSMYPTLNNTSENDIILVNKYTKIDVGDIVIAQTKNLTDDNSTLYLIKRVIAKGGDKVKVIYDINNELKIQVNGEILKEEYLTLKFYSNKTNSAYENWQHFIVNGNYELTANKELIIPENEYFLVGDNREVSVDSTKIGPISKDDIIGEYIKTINNENSFIAFIKSIFN